MSDLPACRRHWTVSIHAPPEGRDVTIVDPHVEHLSFNPRAPGGARYGCARLRCRARMFQSTRPRRGAIVPQSEVEAFQTVSIHAPPEGRDPWDPGFRLDSTGFNPRAPGGARSV